MSHCFKSKKLIILGFILTCSWWGIVHTFSERCTDLHEVEWVDNNGYLVTPDSSLRNHKCNVCSDPEPSSVCYGTSLDTVQRDDKSCTLNESNSTHIESIVSNYQFGKIQLFDEEKYRFNNLTFANISGLIYLAFHHYNLGRLINIDDHFKGHPDLTYLSLEGNGITGWNASGNTNKVLKNLEVLNLANNPIRSLVSSSFKWLADSNLKYLNLRGCDKLNPISYKILAPLKKSLISLDLSQTNLSPAQLIILTYDLIVSGTEKYTGLKSLGLAHMNLKTLPITSLKHLANSLQNLSLQGNPIRNWGDSQFPVMHNLESLNIRACQIELISNSLLDNLKKLRVLLIDENNIMRMESELFHTSELQHISLRYNRVENAELHWSSCPFFNCTPSITSLDLSHTALTATSDLRDLRKLERLSLCESQIQRLAALNMGELQQLKLLNLNYNNLKDSVNGNVFKSLTKLEELQLKSCSLSFSSSDIFEALSNLKILDLSINFIESINRTILPKPVLRKLILHSNQITSWDMPIFSNGSYLLELSLHHNWITGITQAMVEDFYSMHLVDLSYNPFRCNYELADIIEKIKNGNSSKALQLQTIFKNWDKANMYQCTNDNNEQLTLHNLTIETYKKEDWEDGDNTKDKGEMTAIYIISALSVVILLVLICYWKWSGIRMYARLLKNSAILTIINDKESNIPENKCAYKYDIFVSYSDSDRQWILEHLLPNVEQQYHIKVCLHERDFQAGLPVLDNIITCMSHSRCVLLVLSQAFLKSHWCQFELNLAQHQLLDIKYSFLLLVLLEPIPRDKCSKILRYLMLTKTYLQWPTSDNEEDRKSFWQRMQKALSPVTRKCSSSSSV